MALNTIGSAGSMGNIGNAAPQPASHLSASHLPAASPGASAPAARVSATAVQGPVAQARRPSQEQIEKAVESMKQLVEAKAPNSLSFSVDESTGRTIVRVSDTKTGDLIRQIPAEELLDIARSLDKLQGMLLRQET